jgi:hypothetical protein
MADVGIQLDVNQQSALSSSRNKNAFVLLRAIYHTTFYQDHTIIFKSLKESDFEQGRERACFPQIRSLIRAQ